MEEEGAYVEKRGLEGVGRTRESRLGRWMKSLVREEGGEEG